MVLLTANTAEPTSAETLARVDQAFLVSRFVFVALGMFTFLLPRPVGRRAKFLAAFVIINLVCTWNMTYPHIGSMHPGLATFQNECLPMLTGFALMLLGLGNTVGQPKWPRAWSRAVHHTASGLAVGGPLLGRADEHDMERVSRV